MPIYRSTCGQNDLWSVCDRGVQFPLLPCLIQAPSAILHPPVAVSIARCRPYPPAKAEAGGVARPIIYLLTCQDSQGTGSPK